VKNISVEEVRMAENSVLCDTMGDISKAFFPNNKVDGT
jgi:hypothetical protein